MEVYMTINAISLRYQIFTWRESRGIVSKVSLSLAMAALTGVLAGIRIPLPFTPVPITGQVLGVFLGSIFLGRFYGGLSQIFYLFFGLCGIPWFAGWTGISVSQFLSVPSAGYLIGFIFAGFYLGDTVDRRVRNRFFFPQIVSMLAATGIFYFFGALHLAIVLKLTLRQTFVMGILPFIAVDLVKAFIAGSLSSFVLPKKAYNGEVDGKETQKSKLKSQS
jgi:biotin transport system substrate-specific component